MKRIEALAKDHRSLASDFVDLKKSHDELKKRVYESGLINEEIRSGTFSHWTATEILNVKQEKEFLRLLADKLGYVLEVKEAEEAKPAIKKKPAKRKKGD
jgi:hypothetical protein